MPKKFIEVEESSSESDLDYNETTQEKNVDEEQLLSLEQELQRSLKNTELQQQLKEQKKKALEEKRERLAKPKADKAKTGPRTPRYEKGSEAAKEWSRKMAEARRAKLEANKSEKAKLKELEEEAKQTLYKTKQMEIDTLRKQLKKYEEIQQKIDEEPRLPPKTIRKQTKVRAMKSRTPAVSDDETDNATEVEEAKEKVRKKRIQKQVAREYIADEQTRLREQMLKNMQNNILGL